MSRRDSNTSPNNDARPVNEQAQLESGLATKRMLALCGQLAEVMLREAESTDARLSDLESVAKLFYMRQAYDILGLAVRHPAIFREIVDWVEADP